MNGTMPVLDILLGGLPTGWSVTDVYVGANWVLALVRHGDGSERAGVAAAPVIFPENAHYPIGHYTPNANAVEMMQLLRSDDPTAAAVGLATLNALQQPDETALTRHDAADWLSAQSSGKTVAIFGRFPFITDEIRPFAKAVYVFEQNPEQGEYSAKDVPHLIPQADLIAITSSTVINHSIDAILQHTNDQQTVVLLGPSTPLTSRLFDCGITALFGVRVADIEQAKASVLAGEIFRKMHGLERVSLLKPDTC
jgi:uncharacterized protein (DUF4213/DUF364 family)